MIDLDRLLRLADQCPYRIGVGGSRSLARDLRRRLTASGHDIHVKAFSTSGSLVRAIVDRRVDGAIRGVLSSSDVLSRIMHEFDLEQVMRTALMESPAGRPFMLTPVGIDEGRDMASRLELVRNTVSYFKGTGWRLRVGVLSKGRFEDGRRGPEIKMSLREGERLARVLAKSGISARHYAILLEDALKRSDVILAPDGVIGNIIFRSLHLVAGAKAYGAPILNIPTVFVDTSRAKADYLDSVLFAAGLVGLKCDKGPQH